MSCMSLKKQRIVRISSEFPPPWKGLAPGPYELTFAQFRSGHDVVVITRAGKDTHEFDRGLPFKIIRIPSARDVIFSFKAALLARQLCRVGSFDLVHAHGFSAVGCCVLRRLGVLPIPVIGHIHVLRKTQRKKGIALKWTSLVQERLYLSFSDCLIAVNDEIVKETKRAIPKCKIVSVGNGVNINFFTPGQRHDIDGHVHLLFVGIINGRKGELDLLEACRRLILMPWDLLIIGSGPNINRLRESVFKFGLSDRVTIREYAKYSEMPNIYRQADVFVFPSYSEGMPKAPIEAMACGCPVILSDIPGCKELVEEGRNGFLTPVERPDVLARMIKRFIDEPSLSKRMGAAARSFVERSLTWDAVADKIDRFYSHCLTRKQ